MARGRKKQEVEVGYVKERFIVDLILSEDKLAEINETGKTKYISDLVKKDFNTCEREDSSYTLTVTDEIREKFNNDPRRAYLLGQLLTEFYCNIKTESIEMVDTKVEYVVPTTEKVEKIIVIENEEITVEQDLEINQDEIDENIKDVIKNNNIEPILNEIQTFVEEENFNNEELNSIESNGRVGRLNTAPLMKKRLGSKSK